MTDLSRYQHNHYLLRRQWGKLFGANFRLYDPSGQLVMFVQQKAFKLREDIRVYSDEARTQEVLNIKARQIVDFAAAYDVVDSASGVKLGAFRRKGWSSSFARDHWEILGPADEPIGQVIEDSLALALVRKYAFKFLPQSFDILLGEQKICDLRQRWNPFLYMMDVDYSADGTGQFDRRIGLAAAILIAAIEGRQG